MKRLIVTADDFGASVPVNKAVEQAHQNGILTTTSLMVGAASALDAVERAKRMPSLKVGLHVVLVCGRPLMPAACIPDLIDDQGNFSRHLARSGVNFFFRPKIRQQLEAEIRAQFKAFRDTGLALDHVNAHNHMHVHPTVLSLILRVGREYGVRAVRLPHEPWLSSWRGGRNALARRLAGSLLLDPWMSLMKWRLKKARMAYNDYIFGMNDTGHMTEERVLHQLTHLPNGVSEMYFHPAISNWAGQEPGMAGYACEEEFRALISPAVADAVRRNSIQRISFSDLASQST
ncbi:MAG TPA: hopanoid biosynthesis-associated protein HpnK [Burkholderiales bacterium]|nr:hopanoid biosynthesis-associated protein HpnK [Burkholderiales bacterium]